MSRNRERQQELQPGAGRLRPYPVGGVGLSGYGGQRHDLTIYFPGFPGYIIPVFRLVYRAHRYRMIEFYVTGKQYDVYHVAFKGFTKG